ncbi:MAG TPA: DUF6544 family protein, partial [Mucilaginibacter sp.]|nr:DUF6544 family protein [Mucilaginibacter sp.]
MIISAIIIGTLLIVLIIGRVNLFMRFGKTVKHLFAIAKPISGKKFSYTQLTGLPAPVQRYFKYVLKDGQPYISYVSLLHEGQFKTGLDKGWTDIKGEQYFTIEKPGFIWKGTTNLFTARDMYIADKGRLIVSLLSLYNVVDGQGDSFNQGELLRWLAENVWFPTNLLPSDNLNWVAIDENTAKLTFSYNGMSLFYIVTFNSSGEITQMETKRYMDKNKLETWIGKLKNYKEINGVAVPTAIEAIWRLEKGDF